MYLRSTILFGLAFLLINCKYTKQVERVLNININSNQKCYYFINNISDTLKFDRNINIISNSLSDTIILGNTILPPKYIGSFWYGKFKNEKDIMLAPNYKNPSANRIWVAPYKEKKSNGKLVFKLIPKTSKSL